MKHIMKTNSFPVPANENGRIKALYQYNILDTLSEDEYDFITKIASQICNTPAALITLLDEKRQWVKSCFGYDIKETPREISFCNYTILDAEKVNVVPDLRLDKRYNSNPLVTGEPHAVFYAGAPLVTPEGFVLGSICVLDSQTKTLSTDQEEALKALAKQTITTMELRKKNNSLKITQVKLKETNKNLKEFVELVTHDMKTPIANITMLSKGFRSNYKHILDEQSDEYIELIEKSSLELICFIDHMFKKIQVSTSSKHFIKPVDTLKVLNKVVQFLAPPADVEINIEGQFPEMSIDEVSLQQVFQNLITNAIKYNDKTKAHITIISDSDNNYQYFYVSDNGSGIETANLEKIFKKQNLNKIDRYGKKGTGIGLAAVKKIINSMGGNISVDSKLNIGTKFTICIPKISKLKPAA